MLTRDLTCSRNLSQALPVSRPVCVAVIIRGKEKPYAISTDVKKLWKAVLCPFLLQSSGFLLAPNPCVPLIDPCAALWDFPARHQPLLDRAGLSPIGSQGASEKCAKTFRPVHTSCTLFPQALFLCRGTRACPFLRQFVEIFSAEKILAQAAERQA